MGSWFNNIQRRPVSLDLPLANEEPYRAEAQRDNDTCSCGGLQADQREDRRSFMTRSLLKAGAALSLGVVPSLAKSSESMAQAFQPSQTNYVTAEEDQWVSDALGERFVAAGQFIVYSSIPDKLCDSNKRPSTGSETRRMYTASQCGITANEPLVYSARLNSKWTSLNCRECPTTSSATLAKLTSDTTIYISYATYQGERICYACNSASSSYWYRTNGPIGCWFWSGGTSQTNWNYTTCPGGCY